jgi:pimeloyl-ACP methyl ester carboxylesterase
MTSGSEEIRNLGYLAWKNNISWMESQSGVRWDSLISSENARFNKALSKVTYLTKKFQSQLTSKDTAPWEIYGWTVKSIPFTPQQIWTHKKSGFSCKCWDADVSEEYFVAAVQHDKGFERFNVHIYNQKHELIQEIYNTGPSVAIFNREIYYLSSQVDLRYYGVYKWNENDMLLKQVYETSDPKENLELKRGEDSSIYIVKGDFKKKQYCLLPNLHWVSTPHLASGIVSDTTMLPGINEPIEAFSFKGGWIVTRVRGIRTIWKMDIDGARGTLWIWGDVSYDSRNPYRLDISDIRYEPYMINVTNWKLSNTKPQPFPSSYYDHPLPAFVVHPTTKTIKGLLVTAYGAYGTPTHIGTLISRWRPLLLQGWLIASVMVPGSGDYDVAWKESGQRLNRLESIHAFRDSILSLKEEYGIQSFRTALYGRSAGGLLVTSVSIQNPGLVGALYLESPYVDVLRTITNPQLPLTTLETSEFGSLENPLNVLSTAQWSPMEHIPEGGIPDLFVVARADINDLQVYPYEVLKFIHRIRSSGGYNKLVFIHKGLGHFTTSTRSRAEDLALLNNWLDNSITRNKNITLYYKMSPTRKNRSHRKNHSRKNHSRKNHSRKNRSHRRNRNNSMVGGFLKGPPPPPTPCTPSAGWSFTKS